MTCHSDGGAYIITLTGKVGWDDPIPPAQIISEAINSEASCVLLNLESVDLIISPGLAWLFQVVRACSMQKLRFAAFAANDTVAKTLSWVNSDRLFTLFPDKKAAMNHN